MSQKAKIDWTVKRNRAACLASQRGELFDGLLHSLIEWLELGSAHVRPVFAGCGHRADLVRIIDARLVYLLAAQERHPPVGLTSAAVESGPRDAMCLSRSGRRREPRDETSNSDASANMRFLLALGSA